MGRARRIVVLPVLSLVPVFAGGCRSDGADRAGAPAPSNAAVVTHVVDGDTVELDFGGRREVVRLIGIDTPETVKPDSPVECYGPEASARADELLPVGTEVLVERDVEPRDVYGRLLGYVIRRADGLFVNLTMVAEGLARPLTIEPNTAYRDEFVAAATEAEAADRGLWGACG